MEKIMKNMKKLAVIMLCFLNSNIFSVADLGIGPLSCEDFYNSGDLRTLTITCKSDDHTQTPAQRSGSITAETFTWCPVSDQHHKLWASTASGIICNTAYPVKSLLPETQVLNRAGLIAGGSQNGLMG